MTKISNQYSLTNILTADLANSRLGINNVSPTVALDVTGAGKFSGALIGTTATFRVSDNRNLAIKYDTNITLSGQADSGAPENLRIYADTFKIFTSTTTVGLTERLTISNAGNVGIGTSSPSNKLEVIGASGVDNFILSGGGVGATLGGFKFGNGTGVYGSLYFSNVTNDVTLFQQYVSGNLILGTNTTERMRITSGGNVGIGNTSPLKYLHIGPGSDAPINTNQGLYISNNGTTALVIRDSTNNSEFTIQTQSGSAILGTLTNSDLIFYTNNTARMTISTTGNIGAPSGTNIYNASDIRLKQNISKTTYGLDTISALNPVKFNWVDGFEPTEDGKDMLGFIAQEMQNVIPEAIESFGGDINLNGKLIDNPLRVNEKFIIPVLVKAIQELSAKVSLLENK